MQIRELHYSGTNTYLIEGESGSILFDTGWAGTFPAFCRAAGDQHISVQQIDYIVISHFHPDHMGIAQEIAALGPVIVVMDVQRTFIHSSDDILSREKHSGFVPIDDQRIRLVPIEESRSFLREVGLNGEIIYTPGHSEDSISLCLDEGAFFVGDLNPLYELELHRGTQIGESWERMFALNPGRVYYGHAKTAVLTENIKEDQGESYESQDQTKDLYQLTKKIMKYIDRGIDSDRIRKKTGADSRFIEDVTRMYLTHTNVGVQGILDRIEIKNR